MIAKIIIALLSLSLGATAYSDTPESLKIRVYVGLSHMPDDTSNVNCVSNIIPRSMPSTYENALAEVNKIESNFFSMCERNSGRKVIQHIKWDSNQYGDKKIEEWRIHPNDVVVNIK